jgi:hypothetical protein
MNHLEKNAGRRMLGRVRMETFEKAWDREEVEIDFVRLQMNAIAREEERILTMRAV